ncbi:hypothetical protein CEXT_445851 [Caerostris extrusa]|uniref:Secreted protein n=1 Tax=Caerostris extrusa TaxID=172846 RepID=A0AAV4UTW2_CAEEX|nr:hypothetical protein CEXT_445851 [Caerostris extrusa]
MASQYWVCVSHLSCATAHNGVASMGHSSPPVCSPSVPNRFQSGQRWSSTGWGLVLEEFLAISVKRLLIL